MANSTPAGTRAWATLALLSALYVLSFIDRFILAMMIEPIKADLRFTDVQAGLLFGTYFALFYGIVGIPLARFADRGNRKRVILGGVIVWSAATFCSAFAQDYGTLVALRMGLAIGEAALTPAALAVLVETFPQNRKVLACTLYSAAGMLGASLYSVIGAGVLAAADMATASQDFAPWRISLLIVGIPGFILAALVAFVMREPRHVASRKQEDLAAVGRYLADNARLYGGMFTGAAAAQSLGYALIAWSPTLLQRNYGIGIGEAGLLLGASNFVAIVGGTLVMPTLLATAIRRSPRHGAWLPAVFTGTGALLILCGVLANQLYACLVLIGAGVFLTTGTTTALQVLLQLFAPSVYRATLTAILLVFISCIGLGIGPTLAAWAGATSGAGIAAGLAILAVPVMVIAFAALAMAASAMAQQIASSENAAE